MSPTLPRHPLLPGLYHAVPLDPDRIQVCNAGRTVVLKGEGFAERATALLAALDGRTPLAQLEERYPDLLLPVLEPLVERGLVVDADPAGGIAAAASTALAALTPAGGPSPAEAGPRLGAATVVMAGCGPVAGAVAVQLAKAGVGRLMLADSGTATAAEVAGSPVLAAPAEGQTRADAVMALCAGTAANAVLVTPVPPALSVITDADLVVIQADRSGADGALPESADMALRVGIPYMLHGQDGTEAFVGPVVRPGGPCHRCMEDRRLSHISHLAEHMGYLRHRAATAPAPDAFLAAHSALVAGVVATTALRALVDPRPGALNREAVVIDLALLELHHETVLPVPDCAGCATAPVPSGAT